MFNLTISTNAGRSTKIVNVNTTVEDVLEEMAISTQGATVSLNGCVVRDTDATFAELGVRAGTQAMLAVVVKQNLQCKRRAGCYIFRNVAAFSKKRRGDNT